MYGNFETGQVTRPGRHEQGNKVKKPRNSQALGKLRGIFEDMLVRASFALLIVGASLTSAFTVPTSTVAALRPSKYATSSSPMLNKCPRPASTRNSIRLMAVDAAAVKSLVDKASAATGDETAPVKLAKALKKSTGALTVSLEYANPTASMDLADSVDFRTLSADLRRDKGIAIMCDASSERGLVDLQNFEKEQVGLYPQIAKMRSGPHASGSLSLHTFVLTPGACQPLQGRWKGKFPGPCVLIASGGPYTVEQAAKAKAAGADGFYVPAAEGTLAYTQPLQCSQDLTDCPMQPAK